MRDFTKHCVYALEFRNPPFSTNIILHPKKQSFIFFCEARSYVWSTVVCARFLRSRVVRARFWGARWYMRNFMEHGGMCEISWSTVVCVIFHGASCWPVTNNKKIKPKRRFPIDLQQLYQQENCFGGSEIHELRRRPKQFMCELQSVAIESQVWIGLVKEHPWARGGDMEHGCSYGMRMSPEHLQLSIRTLSWVLGMQTANKCEHPMHTPKVQTFDMCSTRLSHDRPIAGCQQAMKQSFTTKNDGHFDQPGTDVKSVWGIILGPFDSSETRSDWMSRAWCFCPLFFCLPYCLWWEVEKEMEGGPVVMLGCLGIFYCFPSLWTKAFVTPGVWTSSLPWFYSMEVQDTTELPLLQAIIKGVHPPLLFTSASAWFSSKQRTTL